MLKRLWKYFCFSLLLLAAACAPRGAPPGDYLGRDLSLEEVISRAGDGVETIKAIADVRIERRGELYDFVNASLLVKKPGWVHMRVYKFGILVRDVVIRDNQVYLLSGSDTEDLSLAGHQIYGALFWWEGLEDGTMMRDRKTYLIRSAQREISVDRATLVPVAQKIGTGSGDVLVLYHAPRQSDDGSWYPSSLEISVGEFRFSVKVRKLLRDPVLGPFDFTVRQQREG